MNCVSLKHKKPTTAKGQNVGRSGFVVFVIGKMIQLQVHLQLPCYDFCFLY